MYQTSILQIATLTWVFVGAVVGDVHSPIREHTDTMRLSYSDHLAFNVTVTPTLLMFYPANDTSKGIELWSSNKPPKSEVWCDPRWARFECRCQHTDYECRWFVMPKDGVYYFWKSMATQKDQGMYVVRGERSRLIYKFQVFVQVQNKSRTVNASQDVDIWFLRYVRMYDLTFHPKDEPQSIIVLVKKGVVLSDRVNVMPNELTLKKVQYDHSGMYQAFDAEGYLFLSLELTVILTNVTKPWLWLAVMVAFAAMLFCLCCCGCIGSQLKSRMDAEPPPEPPPVSNQIEEELMLHHSPRLSTLTSDDFNPPSYDDCVPPSYDQVVHSAFSVDPGLDDEGPSYTMPSAPVLEDFLNVQVPLSPSAPTCDVYTSD